MGETQNGPEKERKRAKVTMKTSNIIKRKKERERLTTKGIDGESEVKERGRENEEKGRKRSKERVKTRKTSSQQTRENEREEK